MATTTATEGQATYHWDPVQKKMVYGVPASAGGTTTPTVGTSNATYSAPKDTSTFQWIDASSGYTPEYYNALKEKYQLQTQKSLTSPEFQQESAATRKQLAGQGILASNAYSNVQSKRVGEIQRRGDIAMEEAVREAMMNEQAFNAEQAAKKATAQTEWLQGQETRDQAALQSAISQLEAKAEALKAQGALNPFANISNPDLVREYNEIMDAIYELRSGGLVENRDYTGLSDINREYAASEAKKALEALSARIDWKQASQADKDEYNAYANTVYGTQGVDYATKQIGEQAKAVSIEPDLTGLKTAAPEFPHKYNSGGSLFTRGDDFIKGSDARADIRSFIDLYDAGDYISDEEIDAIITSAGLPNTNAQVMNPSDLWNKIKDKVYKTVRDNWTKIK